jgi:hypothetical protein
MNINPERNVSLSFNGKIQGKGIKPQKTPLYKDDIALSQLTNNLRRVGIDRAPGVVFQDGSLLVSPGLRVKHNKKGDKITFVVGEGNNIKMTYEIKKNEKGETLSNMPPHKTVFEEAVKFIDKTILKAIEKNNILKDTNLESVEDIYSKIHRAIR